MQVPAGAAHADHLQSPCLYNRAVLERAGAAFPSICSVYSTWVETLGGEKVLGWGWKSWHIPIKQNHDASGESLMFTEAMM